jgi:hypothetical protein
MDQKSTVSINGRSYDPFTGLPLGDEPPTDPSAQKAEVPQPIARAVAATTIHTRTQRSKTLRRSALKRPAGHKSLEPIVTHTIEHNKKPSLTHQTVAKSPHVTKFASPTQAHRPRMMDIGPVRHPAVVRAQAQLDAKNTPAVPKPSHVLKQDIINEAVEKTVKQTWSHKRSFRHPGIASIVTASLALVILGGYLTYLNMPALSVRVAAAQAGIDASYPNYRPDGYSLSGPVAYDQGQVSMKFAANAGPQNFTIKQSKSSWDSAAVLDNYVAPKAGNDYTTYSEHGLTIYSFNGGAAWVNGGILYTVTGDARLSSEQIRHLATSFI